MGMLDIEDEKPWADYNLKAILGCSKIALILGGFALSLKFFGGKVADHGDFSKCLERFPCQYSQKATHR